MKKVLFATTALVATAGVAAADVTFSGYGRFGAVYNSDQSGRANANRSAEVRAARAALASATTTAERNTAQTTLDAAIAAASQAGSSTDVASRFRLQADVSTETDAGVGFNARMRIQVEENATNDSNGIRFGMTYGNLAMNVGNINGVIESTPNLYLSTKSAGMGLEGNGFHSLAVNNANGFFGWTAYSSGGIGAFNGVEVIYSASGLRLHAHSTEDSYAVGGSYAVAGYTFAAGYEEFDNATDDSILLVTVGGTIGAANVSLAYGETDIGNNSEDKYTLAGGYDIGAATNVYGFVATEDAGEAFGLGVSHDLGGSASFEAGYTRTAAKTDILSAGIFFSF